MMWQVGKFLFFSAALLCFLLTISRPQPVFDNDVQDLQDGKKWNILLISVDSLRRDHLGAFGYTRPTSPVIDRLCREGVLFTDVISQSSQTAPSVASLFTGLYPSQHGVHLYSYNQSFHPIDRNASPMLPEGFPTLAGLFQSRGYTTLGIVANPWLKAEFCFGRGFKFYEYVDNWDGRSVNALFRKHLQNLLKDRAFFVYLHYMDVHAPYYSPETFRGLYTPFRGDHVYGNRYMDIVKGEELAYSKALYDERINQADDLIRDIINQLEEVGIREKTLLVITSDHGEEFFEHQGLGHGTSLYAEQIDVFFVLHAPSRFSPKKITQKVRTVDFFPTLLDLAGIPYEKTQTDGHNLLPLVNGFSKLEESGDLIFSELGDKKAVLLDGWKYVYDFFLKTEELYYCKEDRGEEVNLADKEEGKRKKLKGVILGHGGVPELSMDSNPIPEGLKERLRSLGYLSGRADEEHSESLSAMLSPVSDRIDFARINFNPLQLVFGWKKEGGGSDSAFSWAGPHVRFVLSRGDRRQSRLVIEGEMELKDLPGKIQTLTIFCEGRYLGGFSLKKEGRFSLVVRIPPDLGEERPLEFSLRCLRYFLSGKGGGENDTKLSLKISAIYLK